LGDIFTNSSGLPRPEALTGSGQSVAADDRHREAVGQAGLRVRVHRLSVLDGVGEAGATLRLDTLRVNFTNLILTVFTDKLYIICFNYY
jgi:hypothetical protein